MSVKLAREMINTPADARSHIEPSTVFKVVALISILGFLFITGGAIALTALQTTWASPNQPPIGLLLALFGYGSLILIDRQLLKFVGPASSRRQRMPADTSPRPAVEAAPGSTRSLVEGAPFGSVTETTTRQFQEEQRR
jgi:hypothetical protein